MVGKNGMEIGCLLDEKFQKVNPYVLRETANLLFALKLLKTLERRGR